MPEHGKINTCTIDSNNKSNTLSTICMHCKSIKINKSTWITWQEGMKDVIPSFISHGVCPECAARYYPNYVL